MGEQFFPGLLNVELALKYSNRYMKSHLKTYVLRPGHGDRLFDDEPVRVYKNLWLDTMKNEWVPFTRESGPGWGQGRHAERLWVTPHYTSVI